MKIISATIEHVDMVGYVHSTAWKSTYQNIFSKEYLGTDTIDKRKEEFMASLANDNIQYYLVSDNDNAIGIVKLMTEDNICEVSSIYFLKEHRNKGYGTETINYLKKKYHDNRIVLWVLENNVKARKFYKKNQFMETGETRVIYRGNEYMQVKYELLEI
ncbi:MAG: GNAT family N-acetyltransferase [Lachnospiraceae bacterium]|nr:GNAT family N-acetyltransferase [Lachnospiraceae bacterium]